MHNDKNVSSATGKKARARRSESSHVKLEDVARLAGVSTATASRVINSPQRVMGKTRERVEKAIEQLDWIPHGAAQALASLKSNTVGALIPTLGHQTIATMLEALQQHLGAAGYTLLLGCLDNSRERTIEQAAKMIRHGAECLVIMGEDHPSELFAMLRQRKIFHVIAYTTGGMFGNANCIGFDNYAEMAKVVRHLLELGHTSFGVIARTFDHNDRVRHRINAVRDVLAEAGLAVRPQHFTILPEWTIACGRQGMRAILAESDWPTAIICTNDYLACGAVIEAEASGLAIPRDMSITGFDDIELASHITPPLTTIHVPAAEMGQVIADYVVRSLEHGDAAPAPPIEGSLLVRGSTGEPRRK